MQNDAHRRGDADVLAIATTSDPSCEPPNGELGADPCAGAMRSPEMNRKSLLPGATGDRKPSLAKAGFSAVAAGTGDLHANLVSSQ